KVTVIEVMNEEGERAIGKPVGKYITLDVTAFKNYTENYEGEVSVIAEEIKKLLPERGLVLVVGLGNDDITPDALGVKCVDMIFSTRHISGELAKSLGIEDLRPVAALSPGVLGQTGMESVEIIQSIVGSIKPDAVITIDALASKSVSRLGCTVQLTDTGISPGGGVGNLRKEINKNTVGVPVIALGVPTVVDAVTVAADVFNKDSPPEGVDEKYYEMIVTPKEIDVLIERAAKLLALSINCALQPSLSAEDILELI
ncbi:MAG: GPR endopeptidase, partial [Oscillospiraceae bacterium]|nr:GPR endopeptidase [Oscillospiraceae bacterium]